MFKKKGKNRRKFSSLKCIAQRNNIERFGYSLEKRYWLKKIIQAKQRLKKRLVTNDAAGTKASKGGQIEYFIIFV